MPDHGSLPGFEIAVTPAAEGVLVAVSGELDIATASAFEATLLEQLAEGPVRLDLRELSFMDSTGIRVLDAILRDLPVIGSTLLIDPALPAWIDEATVHGLDVGGQEASFTVRRVGPAYEVLSSGPVARVGEG